MNSLNRDIRPGESVILLRKYWKGTQEERTVTVQGGLGMKAANRGTALYVTFPDGEQTRADGREIDWRAMKKLEELDG